MSLARIRFIFLFLIVLASATVEAQELSTYPRTRIHLHENLYSGEKGRSFAESGAGFGGAITVTRDGIYFVPFFSFGISTVSNRQVFLDGATQVTSAFTYYAANTDLGLQFFPIARRKSGFNLYVKGGGILGYNLLAINRAATLTTIPYSDQAFSFGYLAGVGTELVFKSMGPRKWSLTAEVLFREESATLMERQFDLSSLQIALGIGW